MGDNIMSNLPDKMSSDEGIKELSNFFLGTDYYDLLYTYKMNHPVDMDEFNAVIVKEIKKKASKNRTQIIVAFALFYLLISNILYCIEYIINCFIH